MTTPLHLDDRRMRLDARRLALESFVKIHLEHVTGCRQLLLAHQRMIFTLSLGSLAGLVTLYASVMRFGSAASDQIYTPTHILLAVIALVALVASALLSAYYLQQASREAAQVLANPFPNCEENLTALFADPSLDEHQIVRHAMEAIDIRLERQPTLNIKTRAITILLTLSICAAGLSFIL